MQQWQVPTPRRAPGHQRQHHHETATPRHEVQPWCRSLSPLGQPGPATECSSPSAVANKRDIKKIVAGITIPRTRSASLPATAPAWGSRHRATGLGDRAGDTRPRGESPGRAGLHCYRGNTRSVQRVKHSIRLLIEPPSNSITSENGFFNATISCF